MADCERCSGTGQVRMEIRSAGPNDEIIVEYEWVDCGPCNGTGEVHVQ